MIYNISNLVKFLKIELISKEKLKKPGVVEEKAMAVKLYARSLNMIKTINYLFVVFGIGSFGFAPGTTASLITTILYKLISYS